jgi:hypothetical protein
LGGKRATFTTQKLLFYLPKVALLQRPGVCPTEAEKQEVILQFKEDILKELQEKL